MVNEVSRRRDLATALVIGAASSTVSFLPLPAALIGSAVLLVALIAWWAVARQKWIVVFFATLLLFPPVPFPLGDAGAHPAILAAAFGAVSLTVRLDEWRIRADGVSVAMGTLLFAMFVSLPFAALYSGTSVALASALRLILFAFAPMVYLSTVHGPDRRTPVEPLTRGIFWMGVAAALFGCVDFLYQLPAPAGYEPQFLWLDSGVYRRAQGLFYESSTLGNVCSFYLVFVAVCFTQPKERRPISSFGLAAGAVCFGAAMLLSFSRASVLSCGAALLTLGIIERKRWHTWRGIGALACAGIVSMILFLVLAPELAEGYWGRVQLALESIREAPDRALSGRLANWSTVAAFTMEHPWQTVAGIGYKTLPYTEHLGRPVIADNAYLSQLVETGALGFTALVFLNLGILRTSWRALRGGSLHGRWMFCFWIGESLQMFSGDILTYWRVLPLYFWVLGQAARDAEELA